MHNALRIPLAVVALLAIALPARAEVIDRIVAVVNDDIITLSDVIRTIPIYVQVVGVDPSSVQTEDDLNALANEVVEHLIDNRLLVADADERDLLVTDREVDAYLEQQQSAMGVDADQFARALAREGIEMDDFREFMRDNLTRLRMVQLDVVAQINVTEEQIAREVAARYPDGLVDITMTTSQILVAVPPGGDDAAALAQITALREELEGGRPFAEIAAAVNPDASANTGGRIGTYPLGSLDTDYERAAMALEVGEVSEPVRTQFGYHLIRLDAREEEAADDADRIRDRIGFELQEREAIRQEELYLQRVRNDAFIEIRVTEFLF